MALDVRPCELFAKLLADLREPLDVPFGFLPLRCS